MQLLLDTADQRAIEENYALFKIQGVTTNPTILARDTPEKTTPQEHLQKIYKSLKQKGGSLHIQLLAEESCQMLKEAEALLKTFGPDIHIKIPVTKEGLKAIDVLAARGCKITATVIYSYAQAIFAHNLGASNLAIYCNRMDNLGLDFQTVIKEIKQTIPEASIIGASFKNFGQIKTTFLAGADACTVTPELLLSQLDQAHVLKDISTFKNDWKRFE